MLPTRDLFYVHFPIESEVYPRYFKWIVVEGLGRLRALIAVEGHISLKRLE